MAGRLTGQPVESGGEGGGIGEADLECNRGDGQLAIGQQLFGPLDAAIGVISVRRHAEGALERPGEMARAEPRQFGQRRKRDVVGNMLLDVGGHSLLLPTGKAAATDQPTSVPVDANQLVG